MNKYEIEDAKQSIRIIKFCIFLLALIVSIVTILFIILHRTNVISDTPTYWVLHIAITSFFIGLTNGVIEIQRCNEKIMDLQQEEIKYLNDKISKNDEN